MSLVDPPDDPLLELEPQAATSAINGSAYIFLLIAYPLWVFICGGP
jgi:hypothetical protein